MFATTSLNEPTCHTLPNGLTIIAEQLPVEAVNLSLWLSVGSRLEADSINGMAHFLEHMVFKGTPRLQIGEFERRVEARGAVTNAATSQDYTQYYITTAPSDFAELAPLQIDVVLNPSITDADFKQEKSVILEEINRSADNTQHRIYQKSIEAVFQRLPYRRPVLGTTAVVEALTDQQMRFFHATNYQPRSMTAVAVGNLPVQELIDVVTDGFMAHSHHDDSSPQFAGTNQLPQPETPFNRIVRHDSIDPAIQQTRLIFIWRVPGMTDLDATYPLDIVAAVLGQGRTSRLVRDLREERQLVTGVGVSNSSYAWQGMFTISVQLPTANLAEVEQRVMAHVETLHRQEISTAEIDRVRRQVANRHIFANETPSARSGLYGYYQAVAGNYQAGIDYPKYVRSINASAIQESVKIHLSPTAYGVVTVRSAD
jgi:zinc protease